MHNCRFTCDTVPLNVQHLFLSTYPARTPGQHTQPAYSWSTYPARTPCPDGNNIKPYLKKIRFDVYDTSSFLSLPNVCKRL